MTWSKPENKKQSVFVCACVRWWFQENAGGTGRDRRRFAIFYKLGCSYLFFIAIFERIDTQSFLDIPQNHFRCDPFNYGLKVIWERQYECHKRKLTGIAKHSWKDGWRKRNRCFVQHTEQARWPQIKYSIRQIYQYQYQVMAYISTPFRRAIILNTIPSSLR